MKRLLITGLILLIAVIAFSAEPHHQLTRIYILTDSQIPRLLEYGLDIVKVQYGEYVEAVTIQSDIDRLLSDGFRIEVQIEDMEDYYLALNTNLDEMGGFLTYSEMLDSLNQIHAMYPNITTAPYSIGESWEGRDMWVIKVSDNPEMDEDEPEVWYDGLHHAREPIGMQLLLYFLRYTCENYGVIPDITAIVDERELFILPVSNPDGYCYNEQTNPNGGGMWRKNRRDNGSNYGVDLNRNYPFDWGHDNQGSSGSTSSETYRGPYAGSEPEVQAIMDYINSRHIAISHSYHSYGDYVLYPWSADYNGYTPDHTTFTAIAGQFVSWNGYDPGTAWELLYNVNGGSMDWHYGEQSEHYKVMAFSLEVGGSFWPAPNQIQGLCQENLNVNIYTAQIADQYAPPEIAMIYVDSEVDDATGNNNGSADPGENIGLTVILRNNGTGEAVSPQGVITSSDPYLNITSASANYPNIASLTSMGNSTPFEISISQACPFGYEASIEMAVTAAGGYSQNLRFDLLIGDPIYQPTGPDNYGYLAYDYLDDHDMNDYDWVEICADSGGFGNELVYTNDDQVLHLALPFDFQYYGLSYDSITIAANGFLAMGIVDEDDYSNSGIPDEDGPAGMIAPYWEDMSPQRPNSGGVWYWYDQTDSRYIIEFNHVEQYAPTGNFETFQTILYDPAEYPTFTEDGIIKFQFKEMSVVSPLEGTIGIESPGETDGIEYLYDGELNFNGAPLANEMAILFVPPESLADMTITITPDNPPIVIPANGGPFTYSVDITNNGTSPVNFEAWTGAILPDMSVYAPILLRPGLTLGAGASILRNMTQNVPGNAPAGDYEYFAKVGFYPATVYSESSFDFSKSGTDNSGGGSWNLTGWDDIPAATVSLLPDVYSMGQNYPNPFNPETTIDFALPIASDVKISVYNVMGQEVALLVQGKMEAGYHTAVWNAVTVPSGVYFYRMEAGSFTEVKKCLLLK